MFLELQLQGNMSRDSTLELRCLGIELPCSSKNHFYQPNTPLSKLKQLMRLTVVSLRCVADGTLLSKRFRTGNEPNRIQHLITYA
jgi:hypothetical protein